MVLVLRAWRLGKEQRLFSCILCTLKYIYTGTIGTDTYFAIKSLFVSCICSFLFVMYIDISPWGGLCLSYRRFLFFTGINLHRSNVTRIPCTKHVSPLYRVGQPDTQKIAQRGLVCLQRARQPLEDSHGVLEAAEVRVDAPGPQVHAQPRGDRQDG